MKEIFVALSKHYIIFIIISVFLILALIGFLVDEKERKKGKSKINISKNNKELEFLQFNDKQKTLNKAINDNVKNKE